jgi:hypothetical protein
VTGRVDRRIGGKPAEAHRAAKERVVGPFRARYVCIQSGGLRQSTTFRADSFAASRTFGYAREADFINRSNGELNRLKVEKHNKMNGLDRSFSIAPMMDFAD